MGKTSFEQKREIVDNALRRGRSFTSGQRYDDLVFGAEDFSVFVVWSEIQP